MKTKERPKKCKNEHLEYLGLLRETGITTMFGAAPYLKNAYKELTVKEAREILAYWMETFSERHKKD